ncbi:MAG: glycosyltransferase family 2 protein [bacterium]|jgi:GT2 family glycosyltransferase
MPLTLTSVVTLTHNKLDYTRLCLPSLLASIGAKWELIVVDNGSTDHTPDWVIDELTAMARTAGVNVRLIRNKGNVGCSTARNQGAAIASGSRLVFIDNDVALRSRSWLATLGSTLDADPSVGIVGPKLVYPLPPHLIQCAGVGISRTGRVLFRGRGERRDDPRFSQKQDVQCLISACFMIRRELFENAGGFDETFNPVEFEDFDLCYRVRSQGHRIVFDPTVEMYHFESITTAGTQTLPNTGLIIRHGLLFKQRWQSMFESEQGPSDEETPWRRLRVGKLTEVTTLPVTE